MRAGQTFALEVTIVSSRTLDQNGSEEQQGSGQQPLSWGAPVDTKAPQVCCTRGQEILQHMMQHQDTDYGNARRAVRGQKPTTRYLTF